MIYSYLSIEKPCEGLFKEKGSKFIAYAYPVTNEDEIKKIISAIKKEHHSARHWCYAYRLGADKKKFRANDDGEPSGTAGKPILNQLIAADLSDVLLVVVRYFGGTLLGTSGLITAYKNASIHALENAKTITRYITQKYQVAFNTEQTNEVMRRLKEFDASVIKHTFEERNQITFEIRLSYAEKLLSLFKQNNIICRSEET